MRAIGQSVVRTSLETVFDPKSGNMVQETWEGTYHGVIAMEAAFRAIGCRCTKTQNGPHWKLVVQLGGEQNGVTEVPVDTWNVKTEMVEVSIWSHPTVETFMKTFANRAAAKKDILDAVNQGMALNAVLGAIPMAVHVYNLLTRGVEAYEVKRPVAYRTRSYSPRYASRLSIDPIEKFYSTAMLWTAFSVPVVDRVLFPSNPTDKPDNTEWGWRIREQDCQFMPAIGKYEERQTWTFAAWSTLLYTYVS